MQMLEMATEDKRVKIDNLNITSRLALICKDKGHLDGTIVMNNVFEIGQ